MICFSTDGRFYSVVSFYYHLFSELISRLCQEKKSADNLCQSLSFVKYQIIIVDTPVEFSKI